MAWSTILQSGSGTTGSARARTGTGSRSLSLPLLRFSAVLLAAVVIGCLYTWEQLTVSGLLDRLERLGTARQQAYQEGMLELQQLRGASTRPLVETAAGEAGLAPLSADRLIILPPVAGEARP